MILINAIPTVIAFARASHQKSLFVQATLKSNRSEAVSTTVFSKAARMQLTNHVTGLNVPQLKSGMTVAAAMNSQMMPDSGMPTMPTAAEMAFMTTVMTPARTSVVRVSRITKAHSINSPAPIIHHAKRRPAKNNDGHTTSARIIIANYPHSPPVRLPEVTVPESVRSELTMSFYYVTAVCTTPKACPKGLSGRTVLSAYGGNRLTTATRATSVARIHATQHAARLVRGDSADST